MKLTDTFIPLINSTLVLIKFQIAKDFENVFG